MIIIGLLIIIIIIIIIFFNFLNEIRDLNAKKNVTFLCSSFSSDVFAFSTVCFYEVIATLQTVKLS